MKKWNLVPQSEPEGILPPALLKSMEQPLSGDWIIARCMPRLTVAHVVTLTQNGLRAWTPLLPVKKRGPRGRGHKRMIIPALPSFLFVKDEDEPAMYGLAEKGMLETLRPMRYLGVMVSVAGRELEPLHRLFPSSRQSSLPLPEIGQRVAIVEGVFEGMTCVVIGHTRKGVRVEFPDKNFPPVEIPPFLFEKLKA